MLPSGARCASESYVGKSARGDRAVVGAAGGTTENVRDRAIIKIQRIIDADDVNAPANINRQGVGRVRQHGNSSQGLRYGAAVDKGDDAADGYRGSEVESIGTRVKRSRCGVNSTNRPIRYWTKIEHASGPGARGGEWVKARERRVLYGNAVRPGPGS